MPDQPVQRSPVSGPVLYYGDPHGRWDPLLEALANGPRPSCVVLLGDCDLDRPLADVLAPAFAAGIPVHHIHGNHEGDARGDALGWWRNLCIDEAATSLHGRTVEVAPGVTLAGLGGVFRAQIWHPKQGDEIPVFTSRADHQKRRGTLSPRHRASVFPEDAQGLQGRQATVLVTHEAPTSLENGFGLIDDLAAALGVRLIVHGHHHHAYVGVSRTGIPVRGLALAEPWFWDPPAPDPI